MTHHFLPNSEPTYQPYESDTETDTAGDEAKNVGAVRRFDPRLANVIKEHHQPEQRQD